MGEFFSHQTLSSIILIALRLQNCAQKNNLSPNAEITGFRVHVNCRLLKSVFFFFFLPNCYREFNTLWSTLLSCFGIRMLNIVRGMWSRQFFDSPNVL